MNNIKRWTHVSYWIAIFVLIIGLVSFAIANYRIDQDNTQLAEKLNHNKAVLADTQAELVTAQNNFKLECEKSNGLQTDLETANTVIESLKSDEYVVNATVTNKEIAMLAQTVWGEARGCSKIQKSAVVWCVLNRVDAGWGTIAEVITAPNQFHGYSSSYPVTNDIKSLVEDVVARWKFEKLLGGEVGRTLPKEYLYFRSDKTGTGNIFRTKWDGAYEVWNWECWSPYS